MTAAAREVVPASGSMAVGKAVAKELAVELVAETAAVELEVAMAAVAGEAMAAETGQLAFPP